MQAYFSNSAGQPLGIRPAKRSEGPGVQLRTDPFHQMDEKVQVVHDLESERQRLLRLQRWRM